MPVPSTRPDEDKWWYERPWSFEVVAGIDGLNRHTREMMTWGDRLPVTKLAEAIEKGLIHDGWPWELTRKGKAVLGKPRRT